MRFEMVIRYVVQKLMYEFDVTNKLNIWKQK